MKLRWLYAILVALLFSVVTFGVPLFPEWLAARIWGRVNLGMVAYALLLLVPLALALLHLRRMQEKEQ